MCNYTINYVQLHYPYPYKLLFAYFRVQSTVGSGRNVNKLYVIHCIKEKGNEEVKQYLRCSKPNT